MRIFYFSLILRLLIMGIAPTMVLAAELDNQSTQQNKNQSIIKLENGSMETMVVDKFVQLETINQSILKPQIANIPKKLTAQEKRMMAFQKKLDDYTPPKGKLDILVTGYSSTVDQCDGDPFTTASGTRVHKGTMACPAQYPMGTKIKIEGMGTFVCEDRGGAIKGNHFDMWFETRKEALTWGKRIVSAEIKK